MQNTECICIVKSCMAYRADYAKHTAQIAQNVKVLLPLAVLDQLDPTTCITLSGLDHGNVYMCVVAFLPLGVKGHLLPDYKGQ